MIIQLSTEQTQRLIDIILPEAIEIIKRRKREKKLQEESKEEKSKEVTA